MNSMNMVSVIMIYISRFRIVIVGFYSIMAVIHPM